MSVGLVIVSHSAQLADGVVELALQMAHDVQLRAAGSNAAITNIDYAAQVDNLAVRFEPSTVRSHLRALDNALLRLPNANLQLLLEVLLLDL